MPTLGAAFPLLPNQESRFRALCAELSGPRREAFQASQQRLDLVSEHWFLQPGATGSLVIMVIAGPDPARSLALMGSSPDPFDAWVRDEIRALFGVDMTQPPPGLPEHVVEFDG